ncbi:MAG: hypothetical protein AAGK67_18435, partial [Pseudomonadota bacterium]
MTSESAPTANRVRHPHRLGLERSQSEVRRPAQGQRMIQDRSLKSYSRTSLTRTNPTLGFRVLLTQHSSRACGTSFVAARRMSSLQSFARVDFTRTKTVPSPQLHRTTQTRDGVAVRCSKFKVRFTDVLLEHTL